GPGGGLTYAALSAAASVLAVSKAHRTQCNACKAALGAWWQGGAYFGRVGRGVLWRGGVGRGGARRPHTASSVGSAGRRPAGHGRAPRGGSIPTQSIDLDLHVEGAEESRAQQRAGLRRSYLLGLPFPAGQGVSFRLWPKVIKRFTDLAARGVRRRVKN
ncbi:Germ cell-less protein-like 2, partial [Frankliniella fusca]